MDTLNIYRQIIQEVLTPYTKIPYSYGDLQCRTIFDREIDSYNRLQIKKLHSSKANS